MADHGAIAGVSRTLRTLLRDRMSEPVDVTLAPPGVAVSGFNQARVNLYAYQVAENGFLQNQEIPGQGYPAAYGNPPLSLNLHYLMTTHSASEGHEDSDLRAQTILGDAMRVLHDYATVTERLEITRPGAGAVGDPILDHSLLGEFEKIKLTLEPVNLDDLSKLWSAMPEANFRRSVAYEVSVVQIEQGLPRRAALPVRKRRLFATTRQRPEITAAYRTPVVPADVPGDIRVLPGEQAMIEGTNFLAERVWVRFGDLDPIGVPPTGSGQVRIAVPDDEYPPDPDHPAPRPIPPEDRLQPGALHVQVIAEHGVEGIEGGLDKGAPIAAQRPYRSNHAILQLVPGVSAIQPIEGTAADLLTVEGIRLYHPDLASYVFLGDVAIEVREPGSDDPWAQPTPTSVQVPLAEAAAALPVPPPEGTTYPVRVQVNGVANREDPLPFVLKP